MRRGAAFASLALAACGPAPAPSAGPQPTLAPAAPLAPSPPATSAATGAPSPGCAAFRGVLELGDGRRALVKAPALPGPAPAVLVLHGYTGSPETIERTSGWTDFLAGKAALVAYPEGTPTLPRGYGWDTGSARFSTRGVDDVAFLRALVDRLVAERCVDPARVLITGESNGGAMTLLAACDARTHDAFALAAPVIPAIGDETVRRCGAGPALRLLAIAGRRDGLIPYDGTYRPGLAPLLGQEAWLLRVAAARNGCDPSSPDRAPIPGGALITPRACRVAPRLIAVDDGVHTWPGGPVGTARLPPGSFPATAFLWREAGFDTGG